ncbi:MAG: nucleoside phosphorylase [Armatimonadetes bacterium]|nr:nucleoside phosphorylase [Armatimonadota bacterium]
MQELFSPKMFIDWYLKQHKLSIKDLGVAPIVVMSWQKNITWHFAKVSGAKLPHHWPYGEQYPLYTGKFKGHLVSFANIPMGSSGTVVFMEELIACGARIFIGIGLAGSLQSKAPAGTCIIPTSCIREEGTSAHYLNNASKVSPSLRLAKIIKNFCRFRGVKVSSGPIWTTDAPYRELISKVKDYGRQGVLGVDMETSAMYAIGKVRKVEVCNLLIISDELWDGWKPAFGKPELIDAMRLAKQVILDCIAFKSLNKKV